MSYWTDDPFIKRILPLGTASFVKGPSTTFRSPTINGIPRMADPKRKNWKLLG